MKKISAFVLIFLATFLLSNRTASAQDAAQADPKHYKVELENDDVRVLRIHYEPGEKSVMHEHPKGVAVFLTDYQAKFTVPTGEEIPVSGKAGQVMWTDGDKHLPENTGKKAMEVIQIEMKARSAAAFDKDAAMKAIEERNNLFMDLMSKSDSIGLANLYTKDAKFMAANTESAVGRSNIQSVFAGYINAGISKIELKTTEVWGNENMLISEDNWKLFLKDGTKVDHGKAIIIWKKEDGKWKLLRDIFNSDMAIPTSKMD
jgi:ketosteroid isomerase-like protein/quercetin dioxygenase-like cupin family protein